MINFDVLVEKTNSLQNCLKRIHETVGSNPTKLDSLDAQDIVVLNLQRAIQLVIDMASYIVSTKRLGTPQSLKDFFQVLERNQILKKELSLKMQKMIGFRNIAVHDYQAINPEILKSIISNHLNDFEEFYTAVITWAKGPN